MVKHKLRLIPIQLNRPCLDKLLTIVKEFGIHSKEVTDFNMIIKEFTPKRQGQHINQTLVDNVFDIGLLRQCQLYIKIGFKPLNESPAVLFDCIGKKRSPPT